MIQKRKPKHLKHYDYSAPGYYFVSICVQDRVYCLDDVVNEGMALNKFGKIEDAQWKWLNQQYPYVDLDVFQTMPNYFHSILTIQPAGTGRDLCLQAKSLSELIGAFKTTSSKLVHAHRFTNFA